MKRVILIHGNGGGTGQDNWFPWLKAELQKLGVECLNPDFPDAQLARAKIWLPYLKDELKADANTILVGHSSGAIAAMRYAESNPVYGSVLVGAYYTDLGYDDEKQSGYFDNPWQWGQIKTNQQFIIQFASTDDPYISVEESHYLRDKLSPEYHEFTDQGHFGEDGSKLEFPELLAALKQHL